MRNGTFPALADQTAAAARFAEDALTAEGCPESLTMKMNVVFDELFSNVVRYSGATSAHISCGVAEGRAVLSISDDGAPYDPTAAAEPDITLPAGERRIGGLGIFMVKKLMDEVTYRFSDGKNVLTVKKNLSAGSDAAER